MVRADPGPIVDEVFAFHGVPWRLAPAFATQEIFEILLAPLR